MNRRSRIEEAIRLYESIIADALKSKKKIFFISLISPIALVIAAGISIIRSDLGALITSVGLGGANLAAIYATIGNGIETYLKESSSLKRSVKKLKLENSLCRDNDDNCMDNVERILRKDLEELEEAERQR